MAARATRLFIGAGVVFALDGGAHAPSLLGAQVARARSVIDGMVSDSNLVALGEASVAVLGSSLRVTTGENGRFRIVAVPAGQYILTIHRLGYVPVSAAVDIGEADTLRFSFAMRRIATELDTVVVSGQKLIPRLSGFEARRTFGFGTFLTQEDIERRHAVFVADILRAVPNIHIAWSLRDGETASNTRFGRSCAFQVVLDEIMLPTPTDVDLLPSPRDIAGMEVYYTPAMIPLQYRSASSTCGMIIIWTKGE